MLYNVRGNQVNEPSVSPKYHKVNLLITVSSSTRFSCLLLKLLYVYEILHELTHWNKFFLRFLGVCLADSRMHLLIEVYSAFIFKQSEFNPKITLTPLFVLVKVAWCTNCTLFMSLRIVIWQFSTLIKACYIFCLVRQWRRTRKTFARLFNTLGLVDATLYCQRYCWRNEIPPQGRSYSQRLNVQGNLKT